MWLNAQGKWDTAFKHIHKWIYNLAKYHSVNYHKSTKASEQPLIMNWSHVALTLWLCSRPNSKQRENSEKKRRRLVSVTYRKLICRLLFNAWVITNPLLSACVLSHWDRNLLGGECRRGRRFIWLVLARCPSFADNMIKFWLKTCWNVENCF